MGWIEDLQKITAGISLPETPVPLANFPNIAQGVFEQLGSFEPYVPPQETPVTLANIIPTAQKIFEPLGEVPPFTGGIADFIPYAQNIFELLGGGGGDGGDGGGDGDGDGGDGGGYNGGGGGYGGYGGAGELYAGGQAGTVGGTLWGQPYQFNIPPPWGYGGVGEAAPGWQYSEAGPGETFPWTRYYAPVALGPMEEHFIPSFPSYRQFPYAPPGYEAERYLGMGVPETFFEGVTTPSLQSYLAGQLGEYPTYAGFEGALGQPTQQAIADLLGGVGVGIPYEAEQYQRAMGRITEAERLGVEEIGRIAARTGRAESGLTWGPGGQAEQFVTEMGKKRADVAQDFAIRTAEMQQEAKQAAVPMALAEMQFGAGQAEAVQGSRERAWGSETADLFQQYQSRLETATTDYQMRTAQNEMVQAGEERADTVAREERIRVYESAKEAGMNEYEANQMAWEAAKREWDTLYQSVVMAAQQEFQWVAQRRAWSEQRGQIVLGAHQAAGGITYPQYLALAVSSFVKGLGGGLGAGMGAGI